MPTYAYACKSCGHAFDAVQSFSDAALTVCPECGGELRKQYGSIGVTFNGSGFYRTDSRAGSSDGAKGSSDGAKKETTSSGGGASAPASTSSKSETKSTSTPSAS